MRYQVSPMNYDVRARVFISCGQKEQEEIEIARKIADKFQEMGFDPYIAVEEHVLKGFTENILPRLDESEYYLFIDFRREQLFNSNLEPIGHRGSLFSHQELAIATFLDKPVIAFQEDGLKPRDGIIGYLQLNSKSFSDRTTLPDAVEKAARDAQWNPNSRYELILDREANEFESVSYGDERIPTRIYHIDVKNLHHLKTGQNCASYLESIRNVSTGEISVPEPVEMKWKGMKIQQALIPPRFTRKFDAILVFQKRPNEIYIGINTFLVDYSRYLQEYRITEPGKYELQYVIFSDNFRRSEGSFMLEIGSNMEVVRFNNRL